MSRFDRYVLAQMLGLCGLFALVLVGILWVNRAVLMFNRMAADGHALRLILEMTALSLPGMIVLALPVSAFAAVTYATNRLIRESELVVMQAVGFSAFRLARPVVVFGIAIALVMSVLVHFIAPAARAALAQREAAVARDVTSGLLREGVFQFPAPGITLFVRRVGSEGRLENILLVDARDRASGRQVTYTAASGQLFAGEDLPGLVLREGMAQAYTPSERSLVVSRFAELALPLSDLVGSAQGRGTPLAAVSTPALLVAGPDVRAATGRSPDALRAEGHLRLAQPPLALATALLGFGALMLGAFSRFGLSRQIMAAVVMMIGMQMIATWAQAQIARDLALWPLVWLAPGLGVATGLGLLWQIQRPRPQRGLPTLAPAHLAGGRA